MSAVTPALVAAVVAGFTGLALVLAAVLYEAWAAWKRGAE